MRHQRCVGIILAGIWAMLQCVTGGTAVVAHARDTKSALTADQAVTCITTAVAAKPGMVKKAKVEDGKQLCEVEILSEDSAEYELHVDLDTNTVVKIKQED